MLNSIEPLFLRDFYALINELLGAFILLEMNIGRSLYFLQFSSGPQTEISQVVPEVLKSIGGSLHLHMVSNVDHQTIYDTDWSRRFSNFTFQQVLGVQCSINHPKQNKRGRSSKLGLTNDTEREKLDFSNILNFRYN